MAWIQICFICCLLFQIDCLFVWFRCCFSFIMLLVEKKKRKMKLVNCERQESGLGACFPRIFWLNSLSLKSIGSERKGQGRVLFIYFFWGGYDYHLVTNFERRGGGGWRKELDTPALFFKNIFKLRVDVSFLFFFLYTKIKVLIFF